VKQSPVQHRAPTISCATQYTNNLLCNTVHLQTPVQHSTPKLSCATQYTNNLLCNTVHQQSPVQHITPTISCATQYTNNLLCNTVHQQSPVQHSTPTISCATQYTFTHSKSKHRAILTNKIAWTNQHLTSLIPTDMSVIPYQKTATFQNKLFNLNKIIKSNK